MFTHAMSFSFKIAPVLNMFFLQKIFVDWSSFFYFDQGRRSCPRASCSDIYSYAQAAVVWVTSLWPRWPSCPRWTRGPRSSKTATTPTTWQKSPSSKRKSPGTQSFAKLFPPFTHHGNLEDRNVSLTFCLCPHGAMMFPGPL